MQTPTDLPQEHSGPQGGVIPQPQARASSGPLWLGPGTLHSPLEPPVGSQAPGAQDQTSLLPGFSRWPVRLTNIHGTELSDGVEGTPGSGLVKVTQERCCHQWTW